MDNQNEISVAALKQKLEAKETLFILDIRPAADFRDERINSGTNQHIHVAYIDMVKSLENDPKIFIQKYVRDNLSKVLPKDIPIIVVCRRGNSSLVVSKALKELGYCALSLAGGMHAW